MDVDHGSNKSDNFVDSFAININSSVQVGEILAPKDILQGTYGFATIGLTVRVLCADHFYGERCVNLNECSAFQDCSGNGICTDSIISYNCDCNPGYTGQQCQIDINECLLMVPECSGQGWCMDGINSYTCNCDEGYTGRDCETDINECLLMEPQCSGHGTCTDGINKFICDCNDGFTDLMCETNIDDCVGVNCSGHGHCTDNINSFTCNCSEGFTGQVCETNIDDCVGVNCSGHGQCMDGVNNFTCLCQSGFTGVLCSMNTQGNNYRVFGHSFNYTQQFSYVFHVIILTRKFMFVLAEKQL